MRRFLLLVVVAAIAAAAIWYALRGSVHTSSAAITGLLPKETLAFVHLPEPGRIHAELHQTDLYQIWSEPAVQDFLQRPRAKFASGAGFSQALQDCESIEMKDAFLAMTSWENNDAKLAGGFRFKGKPEEAQKIVARWRAKYFEQNADAKRETTEYQQHQIEILSEGTRSVALAYDGNWFLAANDEATLRILLDRLDGRAKDQNAVLASDGTFAAAFKHMPSSYAALTYARVDRVVEKLMPAGAKSEYASTDQTATIRQIRSFCGATSFDGAKIRDTIFVGMPKLMEAGDLARASRAIGTKDTFLYATGFLNVMRPLQLSGPQAAVGWAAGLQKITEAISANGITAADWNSAFGPEFGLIGDWPSTSRWPALFATLPVKEPVKAKQILTTITVGSKDGATWTHQEKNAVHYFSTQTGGQFFAFSPTLGLSERMLVAGADMDSVEAAMKRSGTGSSELSASKNFQNAERSIPTARQAFTYIDPALIYTRVDAALRPMLFMSAAFLPHISDTVDLNKLPAAEVITKHLSPIVMSQNYKGDGYVAESVGPITVYQTIGAAVSLASAATMFYQQQTRGPVNRSNPMVTPIVSPTPLPSATASPSPDESP